MHIDKYKIVSIDYDWKHGKQSKNTSVQQEMTSKESIMDRTLCIPLHQSLTDDDVNHICDVIYNFNL